MNANKAAEGALQTYLGMENPEYAILVDAPWGSGKTHFVKKVCLVESNSASVRYVSLNGVSDEHAFRRALLKDSLELVLTDTSVAIGNAIFKIFKVGDLGNLAQEIVENRLISILPDTIIFDDLERATICPEVLFGLINDFVEHKKKRVILLAHSGEHKTKEIFRAKKEKLVGKTLSIEPDFNAAFPEFISKIEDGLGLKYFKKNYEAVKVVFQEAGHQNLRLLRNAVRDCALVLDRIDEELFEAKEPMARFVKTYLALGMSLAKGEIKTCHLEYRANWKIIRSGEEDEKYKFLNTVYKRHTGADIFVDSSAVIQKDLAELLFIKGHADQTSLNNLLRSTGQFTPQDENPLWKRMVYWARAGWDDLEELVTEGKDYLFKSDTVDAGPYLQVADSMLRIQEYGGLEDDRTKLANSIVERVHFLGDRNGIPPAKLGISFGWGMTGRQFSFGGYVCDANNEFFQILEAMKATQLAAYQRIEEDVAEDLLLSFENELAKFHLDTSYTGDGPSFYRVQILHNLDINRFASAALRYLGEGKSDELGSVFQKLAERHTTNEDWQDEKAWFVKLRKKMEKESSKHSMLARAHLENFLGFNWKFIGPDKPPSSAHPTD